MEQEIKEEAVRLLNLKRPTEDDKDGFIALANSYRGKDADTFELIHIFMKEVMGMGKREAAEEIKRLKVTSALGQYPRTHREFCSLALEAVGFRHRLDGMFDRINGPQDSEPVASDKIITLVKEKSYDLGIYKDRGLDHAWTALIDESMNDLKSALFQKLQFRQNTDDVWSDLIRTILTDQVRNDERFVRATRVVLQSWMWRVKNQLRGYRVYDQIMPVLYGGQGTGKSRFTRWLFDPIEAAYASNDFSLFEHTSQLNLLRETPVIWMDEMSYADRQDSKRIKSLMTGVKFAFRRLYSEVTNDYIRASFWGCSNIPVSEMIMDATGNRRFWEVPFRKVDVDAIADKFGALELWQSVDENGNSPHLADDDRELIAGYQAQQRYRGPVETWVDESENLPVGEWKRSSHLFELYQVWEDRFWRSKAPMKLPKFGKEMTDLADRIDWIHREVRREANYYKIDRPTARATGVLSDCEFQNKMALRVLIGARR